MASLVSCSQCGVPCKISEDDCPHCGRSLRDSSGGIPLTAAAALLGLTMSACQNDPEPVPAYGVPEPPPVLVEPSGSASSGPAPTVAPTASAVPAPSVAPTASAPLQPKVPPPAMAPAYGVAPPIPPDQPK